ncbi:MAG TPA: sensor histidine kinase, partial [Prosthecobacter sp.]|nr:sensor histidine kinase [Prosthecobacter sp.]
SEQTSSRLLEKSRQMQEELRHLSRQLLSAQEEERRKISRELHDVIAQTLTGINVRLAALKGESAASIKDLQSKITSTQRLVEKSVDIIHRFARELRPTVLDDLGLIPALQSFLKGYMEDTGIRVTLTVFAGIEHSDSDTRTVLYRIAQEALANVSRHSKASHADVSIQETEGLIRMEIKDDGQGFEVDGTTQAKTKNNRLGLLGMRERVEMVGGTFCVESTPGTGTTVRVEIPQLPTLTPP